MTILYYTAMVFKKRLYLSEAIIINMGEMCPSFRRFRPQ